MLGEGDETARAVIGEPGRAFSTRPARRRAAIVSAGPAMNFVFAFLVYAILFATVGAEVPSHEARIGGGTSGMPAERAGLKPADPILPAADTPISTSGQLPQAVPPPPGPRPRLTVAPDRCPLP